MNLPILTCSYCMRKVGLWNFHQMEGTGGDGDASPNTVGASAQATVPASAATHEGQGDQPASASTTPATTPCRMKLRSQDSTRSEQASLKRMKVDQLNKRILIDETKSMMCRAAFFYHALLCVTG